MWVPHLFHGSLHSVWFHKSEALEQAQLTFSVKSVQQLPRIMPSCLSWKGFEQSSRVIGGFFALIWVMAIWVYIYIKMYQSVHLRLAYFTVPIVQLKRGKKDTMHKNIVYMYTHTHIYIYIKSGRIYIIKQQCLVDFRCWVYGWSLFIFKVSVYSCLLEFYEEIELLGWFSWKFFKEALRKICNAIFYSIHTLNLIILTGDHGFQIQRATQFAVGVGKLTLEIMPECSSRPNLILHLQCGWWLPWTTGQDVFVIRGPVLRGCRRADTLLSPAIQPSPHTSSIFKCASFRAKRKETPGDYLPSRSCRWTQRQFYGKEQRKPFLSPLGWQPVTSSRVWLSSTREMLSHCWVMATSPLLEQIILISHNLFLSSGSA